MVLNIHKTTVRNDFQTVSDFGNTSKIDRAGC